MDRPSDGGEAQPGSNGEREFVDHLTGMAGDEGTALLSGLGRLLLERSGPNRGCARRSAAPSRDWRG